jgi:hypothetical protein
MLSYVVQIAIKENVKLFIFIRLLREFFILFSWGSDGIIIYDLVNEY